MRTNPHLNSSLQPLEDTIRQRLIPAITGRTAISNLDRELLSLPVRIGGLNIPNPTIISPQEYHASLKITAPLVDIIYQQTGQLDYDTEMEQRASKSEVRKEKREAQSEIVDRLHPLLPPTLQKLMHMASEKGLLAALPVESHGFSLHKRAFRDAMSLRYGWQPSLLPTTCICGKSFTVDHALNCPTGGFPSICHNEICDLTANLMAEVCHDVCVEPSLQPLCGEHLSYATEDAARLDVRARGFLGLRQQCADALLICTTFLPLMASVACIHLEITLHRKIITIKYSTRKK